MNKKFTIILLAILATVFSVSFDENINPKRYQQNYFDKLSNFKAAQVELLTTIEKSDLASPSAIADIARKIEQCRLQLKAIDFWLRYLEPIAYRNINGPLPVEWETEVFEKYEPPYRRLGGGITLAELALEE